MYGIWQKNPGAFYASNMHRLNSGVSLEIPFVSDIGQVSHRAAYEVYAQHLTLLEHASRGGLASADEISTVEEAGADRSQVEEAPAAAVNSAIPGSDAEQTANAPADPAGITIPVSAGESVEVNKDRILTPSRETVIAAEETSERSIVAPVSSQDTSLRSLRDESSGQSRLAGQDLEAIDANVSMPAGSSGESVTTQIGESSERIIQAPEPLIVASEGGIDSLAAEKLNPKPAAWSMETLVGHLWPFNQIQGLNFNWIGTAFGGAFALLILLFYRIFRSAPGGNRGSRDATLSREAPLTQRDYSTSNAIDEDVAASPSGQLSGEQTPDENSTPHADAELQLQARLREAVLLISDENFALAQRKLNDAVNQYPDCIELKLMLAELFRKTNNLFELENAIHTLEAEYMSQTSLDRLEALRQLVEDDSDKMIPVLLDSADFGIATQGLAVTPESSAAAISSPPGSAEAQTADNPEDQIDKTPAKEANGKNQFEVDDDYVEFALGGSDSEFGTAQDLSFTDNENNSNRDISKETVSYLASSMSDHSIDHIIDSTETSPQEGDTEGYMLDQFVEHGNFSETVTDLSAIPSVSVNENLVHGAEDNLDEDSFPAINPAAEEIPIPENSTVNADDMIDLDTLPEKELVAGEEVGHDATAEVKAGDDDELDLDLDLLPEKELVTGEEAGHAATAEVKAGDDDELDLDLDSLPEIEFVTGEEAGHAATAEVKAVDDDELDLDLDTLPEIEFVTGEEADYDATAEVRAVGDDEPDLDLDSLSVMASTAGDATEGSNSAENAAAAADELDCDTLTELMPVAGDVVDCAEIVATADDELNFDSWIEIESTDEDKSEQDDLEMLPDLNEISDIESAITKLDEEVSGNDLSSHQLLNFPEPKAAKFEQELLEFQGEVMSTMQNIRDQLQQMGERLFRLERESSEFRNRIEKLTKHEDRKKISSRPNR
jgi:hypothetical protein